MVHNPHTTPDFRPMTAGNMRQNGVHHLLICCPACDHEATVNIDHIADAVVLVSLYPRFRCTACGNADQVDVRPNWQEGRNQMKYF